MRARRCRGRHRASRRGEATADPDTLPPQARVPLEELALAARRPFMAAARTARVHPGTRMGLARPGVSVVLFADEATAAGKGPVGPRAFFARCRLE